MPFPATVAQLHDVMVPPNKALVQNLGSARGAVHQHVINWNPFFPDPR